MVVHESEFTKITYESELSLQTQIWKHTNNFNENLYMQEVTANANAVKTNKPQFLISDTTNFTFPVVPKLQDWSVENFFNIIVAAGCVKYGIILSNEIFAEVSIQQAVDENPNQQMEVRYFDSIESAKKWFEQ